MRVALVALQGHHLFIAHNFCITDFELRKHILYVVGTVQPYDLFVCHEAVLLLWRMVAGTSWETSARRCETWGIRVEVTSRIQVRSSTHASALAGLGERHWDVDCIGSDGIYWADSNVWFQYVRCHIIYSMYVHRLSITHSIPECLDFSMGKCYGATPCYTHVINYQPLPEPWQRSESHHATQVFQER